MESSKIDTSELKKETERIWTTDKISHKGMKRKILELEDRIEEQRQVSIQVAKMINERIDELEKRPQARYCELCSQTTFKKFEAIKWEKNGKEFEICPDCARLEYKQMSQVSGSGE